MTFTFEQAAAYFTVKANLDKAPSRDRIMVRCPFHGDRTESLSIDLGQGGLWHCHACNIGGGLYEFEKRMFGATRNNDQLWDEIYRLTGATRSPGREGQKLGREVAVYTYLNPDGKLEFEKARYQQEDGSKTFRIRRKLANGTTGWHIGDAHRWLYRVRDVMDSDLIFVCEGEKDCDNLRTALGGSEAERATVEVRPGVRMPIATTCNFDGAGEGKWLPEYSAFFAGKRVVIFSDNDAVGRAHANAAANASLAVALSVKVVHLPGLAEHGDVSDYLETHPVSELLTEVKNARRYSREVGTPEVVEVARPFFERPADVLPAGVPGIQWWMPRVVHKKSRGLIVAAPKAGKSMIGLDLALALSSGQSWLGLQPARSVRTAVVSREDSPAMTMTRLAELSRGRGLDYRLLPNLWLNTFEQRRSFAIDNDEHLKQLCEAVKAEGIELVICDVLNKIHSADENSNTEMTKIMKRFDVVQAETGSDVAIIHHDTKNSVPGSKKPRGASAIDSWWDWKVSIDVDSADDTRKEIFFGTKASMPHPMVAVKFFSHPVEGMRILPIADQVEAEPKASVIPFGRTGTRR